MKLILPLLMTILLGNVASAQDEAVKEEIKKLQGNWIRTSFSADGKSEDDGNKPAEKAITLKIKGSSFDGQQFKLDITKNPRHIDLTDIGPKGKQYTMPGIYELKGDVLKICFPFPFEGKFDEMHKRPTEFAGKAGENNVVEVYRRVKK